MTPPAFLLKLAGSGFRFERMTAKEIDAVSADGPAATLERFRAVQDASSGPPGPSDSWLGETLVHGEDIARGATVGKIEEGPVAASRQRRQRLSGMAEAGGVDDQIGFAGQLVQLVHSPDLRSGRELRAKSYGIAFRPVHDRKVGAALGQDNHRCTCSAA